MTMESHIVLLTLQSQEREPCSDSPQALPFDDGWPDALSFQDTLAMDVEQDWS